MIQNETIREIVRKANALAADDTYNPSMKSYLVITTKETRQRRGAIAPESKTEKIYLCYEREVVYNDSWLYVLEQDCACMNSINGFRLCNITKIEFKYEAVPVKLPTDSVEYDASLSL